MSIPVYQLVAIIDKLAAQTLIKLNAGGFMVTYVNLLMTFLIYIVVLLLL
jgi:hypothetical protein